MKVYLVEATKLWHVGKLHDSYGPPDFHVRRKGSASTVGAVSDEPDTPTSHHPVYIMDHRVHGGFAKYVLDHAHKSGFYKNRAHGTTKLVSIRKQDVEDAIKHYIYKTEGAVQEDTRATPQTIATRRKRLAAVLQGYRKHKRVADGTADQIRGHAPVLDKSMDPSKVIKSFNSVGVLGARMFSHQKKAGKHLKHWAKASSYQGLRTVPRNRSPINRAALDDERRPANPKTYGKGSWDDSYKTRFVRNKP